MPQLRTGLCDVVYYLEGPGEKFLVVSEMPWKESPVSGTLEQVTQRVAEELGTVAKSAANLGSRLVGVKITMRNPEPVVSLEPTSTPEPTVCGGPGGPISTLKPEEVVT